MSNEKRKAKWKGTGAVLCGIFISLKVIAFAEHKRERVLDKENMYLSKTKSDKTKEVRIYENLVKPVFDRIFSFLGLILLSPVYVFLSIAILIDDPGPIFFKQKRVGKDKSFFYLHKFRTMKIDAPHDVPTHLLIDANQYITRIGRIMRAYSLDELPQLWDIFRGKMSVIGPRPALWNQNSLVKEREKREVNRLLPGLTGLAQIKGRDELDIIEKAELDGQYATALKSGNMKAFFMDIRCFFGTFAAVLRHDGVVEGGTGEIKKQNKRQETTVEENGDRKHILVVCQYYYPENFQITPICEALVKDGYKVTVLTGLPNYPEGTVPDAYKYGHREEWINNVRVVRCYEIGRKKGAAYLIFNYFSFLVSAMKKVRELEGNFNLVLCYQLSPVLMGLPAKKYAEKHHVPFIVYCCDIWPESVKMYIHNESNPIFVVAKAFSRYIYSAADRIIAQSTSFMEYLNFVHGIEKDKIAYIPAFADETYMALDFDIDNGITDFVFLGNLGIAQDLISVLKAVKLIKNRKDFKVHFIGDGVCLEEMKTFVKAESLEHVVLFYGHRPVDEMPEFYRLADVCLVSLKADNATGYTLPSKVQGYMAAGKPILGMIDGSARDIIEESGCGICVTAGDINALAEAMIKFITEPEKYKECGIKGRKYFKEHFTKNMCIKKIEEEIEKVKIVERKG